MTMSSICFKTLASRRMICWLSAIAFTVTLAIFGIEQVATNRYLHSSISENEKKISDGKRTGAITGFEDEAVNLKDAVFGIYVVPLTGKLVSGELVESRPSLLSALDRVVSSSCLHLRRLIIRVIIDRTDDGAVVQSKLSEGDIGRTVAQCRQQKNSHVDLELREVTGLERNIRALTSVMVDDYVYRNVTYFHVLFADNVRQFAVHDMARLLLRQSPRLSGLVADFQPASETLSSVLFSRIHFEIFGWFFNPALVDLDSAVKHLLAVYEPKAMVVRTRRADSRDSSDHRMRLSSWELNILQQDEDTLEKYLAARRSKPCITCPDLSSAKVISMSLYGASRRYTIGALRNAQLLPVVFPGWRLWFYVENVTDQGPGGAPSRYGQVPAAILAKLQELGAEIRYVNVTSSKLAPMLWRFSIVDDPAVDVFIVRDCDSRLTPRDAAVVSDWLTTDKVFHCIRDHPSHSRYTVSGGLWGARRKQLAEIFGEGNLTSRMRHYGSGYVQDMNFLGSQVWPHVLNVTYCHDSYTCTSYPSSHPFPVTRVGAEHLGEVYNEFSIGRRNDVEKILMTPVNRNCVLSVNSTERTVEYPIPGF